MDGNERVHKFSLNLFGSLMLLHIIPFFHTLMRTNFIANSPVTDGLGIAGHIEWFDLINETIQAFLIVPLYALLNQCIGDMEKFKKRIFQLFFIVNSIYIIFSVLTLIYCQSIVSLMVFDHLGEVTRYLALETVGFVIGNVVCFVNVLFVVLGRPLYIYAMVILQTIFTMMGDLFFIPSFGINGVAYSNIAVSSICVVLCMTILYRQKLVSVSFQFEKSFVRDYCRIGLFSGFQILLDNIIYSVAVCKMVNAVAEQGNYWVANHIIWGLLLIPISALAEVIQKDCRDGWSVVKIKKYHRVILPSVDKGTHGFAPQICDFAALLSLSVRPVRFVPAPCRITNL